MTVEVAFVAYDVYQQEGSKLFSNSHELLLLQSVVFVIPHVLARSTGSQIYILYMHSSFDFQKSATFQYNIIFD